MVKKMGKLVMDRKLNKAPSGLRADLAPVWSSQQQELQRKGNKEVGPLSSLSSPPGQAFLQSQLSSFGDI